MRHQRILAAAGVGVLVVGAFLSGYQLGTGRGVVARAPVGYAVGTGSGAAAGGFELRAIEILERRLARSTP